MFSKIKSYFFFFIILFPCMLFAKSRILDDSLHNKPKDINKYIEEQKDNLKKIEAEVKRRNDAVTEQKAKEEKERKEIEERNKPKPLKIFKDPNLADKKKKAEQEDAKAKAEQEKKDKQRAELQKKLIEEIEEKKKQSVSTESNVKVTTQSTQVQVKKEKSKPVTVNKPTKPKSYVADLQVSLSYATYLKFPFVLNKDKTKLIFGTDIGFQLDYEIYGGTIVIRNTAPKDTYIPTNLMIQIENDTSIVEYYFKVTFQKTSEDLIFFVNPELAFTTPKLSNNIKKLIVKNKIKTEADILRDNTRLFDFVTNDKYSFGDESCDKNLGIKACVKATYFYDNKIYLKFEIKNKSKIPFNIKNIGLNLFTQSVLNESDQESEAVDFIDMIGNVKTIGPDSKHTFLFSIKKMSVSETHILNLTIQEDDGVRELQMDFAPWQINEPQIITNNDLEEFINKKKKRR